MNVGSLDMSIYLHSYEAYRVPQKKISDDLSENGSSSEKTSDQLILTDEARKQMIQDRADYAAAMMEEALPSSLLPL